MTHRFRNERRIRLHWSLIAMMSTSDNIRRRHTSTAFIQLEQIVVPQFKFLWLPYDDTLKWSNFHDHMMNIIPMFLTHTLSLPWITNSYVYPVVDSYAIHTNRFQYARSAKSCSAKKKTMRRLHCTNGDISISYIYFVIQHFRIIKSVIM